MNAKNLRTLPVALFVLVLSAATTWSQSINYNFNDGQLPAGTSVAGNANSRVADDGTGNNVMHLTDDNVPGVQGYFIIPDIAGGRRVGNLTARWRSRIGGATQAGEALQFNQGGADGYSFNWAPSDTPDPNPAEDGTLAGLSVAIDTFDNGGGEAPSIEIRYNNTRVAFDPINAANQEAAKTFLRKDQFVDVELVVDQNTCEARLTYDGRSLIAPLPGWTGIAGGKFVFGGRTGGAHDNHWIDDLQIVAGVTELVTNEVFGLTNQVWKYEEVADLTGTGWEQSGFNDSAWPQGQAVLAFETSAWVAAFRNTVLQDPRLASNPPPGHARYFRTRFNWSGPTAGVTLVFNARVDDGAIFYLNGTEVYRLRPPPEPITHGSVGSPLPCGGDADCGDDVFLIPGTALVAGENVLAVAVYQNATGSSDVVFGAGLKAVQPLSPTILDCTQPSNRVVFANRATTLSVNAIGSPALSYQWYKDGVAIDPGVNPSATTANYEITSMQPTDAGSYFVRISNSQGTVDSRTAVVEYVNDQDPPQLVRGVGSGTFDKVIAHFDEQLDPGPASDAFNFGVTDGVSSLLIDAAVLNPDGRTVTLTLNSTTPLAPNTVYTLTAQGIVDLAGNTMSSGSVDFRSPVLSPCNGVLFEAYHNIGGNAVSLLTSHASFPNNPADRATIGGFNSRLAYPDDSHESYGARMSGVFIPPVSGNWVFYLRSDDASELWLNPNGINSSGRTKVAEETSCCAAYMPVGNPRTSQPVPMQAGQGYYLEVLYKEGGGGDYGMVAARLQGQPVPPNDEYIGGDMVGYPAAPVGIGGNLTITQEPADQTVFENSVVTLSVQANSEHGLPICYQWKRDGADIPGATLASYSFGPATLADNGARFQVVVSILGAVQTSREATVTVQQDTTLPQCVSASAMFSLSNIVIRFSEFMAVGPASDTFNFTVPGYNVIGAVLNADRSSVTLAIDGRLNTDTTYQVTAQGQTDLSGNSQENGSCTLSFRTPTISCGFALQELYHNIGNGVAVSDLTSNPKYPNNPDSQSYVGLLEGPLNTFDNYGTRITGWLIPPVSGNYHFFMSSDDGGEFWLSTDAAPANRVLIAREPVWANSREWTGNSGGRRNAAAPENQSRTLFPAGIPMVTGQMYYFEMLAKEGGGGDNSGVAWQIPGSPEPANGSSPISGAHMASLADPTGVSIEITQQPADQLFIFAPSELYAQNFTGTDGGFTVETPRPFDGPWMYNSAAGTWRTEGQNPENGQANTTILTSPTLNISKSGQATVTLTHSYNFESGFWDGGQLRVSVNGGAFTAVDTPAYNGTVLANSLSELRGQRAWVESSGGLVTHTVSLGNLNAGDSVRVQLYAAADSNTSPDGDWIVDRIAVNQGVAGPTTVTFTVAATASRPGNPNPQIFYQWFRDGAPILGGNSASYTLTPNLADNGAQFHAQAYTPGGTATSAVATLTVVQPNTPPTFALTPPPASNEDAGPQTVPGVAHDITTHSYQRSAPLAFQSDFSSAAGLQLGGRARVEDGILKLVTAPDPSQYGAAAVTAPETQTFDSLDISWKSLLGGGSGADGYSLSLGEDVPADPGYGGEEGIGTGLIVAVDTFDNGQPLDPGGTGVELKWRGQIVTWLSIPKDDPGSGNYLRKNAFVDASIRVTPNGTATLTYDGNAITVPLPNYTGLRANRALFWARTGGADDNHWVDDLDLKAFPADASTAEANQTVHFIVSNDNPSLFAAQPAISPDGTLTYTAAENACGQATVTVVAQDNGGTAHGGRDTSEPQTFVLTVNCVNDCPVATPPPTITVEAGTSVVIVLTGTDVEGDPLSATVTSSPSKGTLSVQNGQLTYTAGDASLGADSFTFTVSDGSCTSAAATVNIEILEGNVPPVCVAKISPGECGVTFPHNGKTYAIAVKKDYVCLALDGSGSTDPDGDALTISWVIDETNVVSGTVVTNCLDVGCHTITMIASDGRTNCHSFLDICIIEPAEAVEQCIDLVESTQVLRKNKRPLLVTLKAAKAAFDREGWRSGFNMLRVFQHKVRAQIARHNPAEAAMFIECAENIIKAVECVIKKTPRRDDDDDNHRHDDDDGGRGDDDDDHGGDDDDNGRGDDDD